MSFRPYVCLSGLGGNVIFSASNLDRGLISSSFATYGCFHPCFLYKGEIFCKTIINLSLFLSLSLFFSFFFFSLLLLSILSSFSAFLLSISMCFYLSFFVARLLNKFKNKNCIFKFCKITRKNVKKRKLFIIIYKHKY